ncbi:MAG: extracellular solute-binding protein [Lachnospiraceae bacterium]|nr:extracellular solute-binding protein [Lachnospiraceae bacterium]
MKKWVRIIAGLSALLMILASLAACGGETASESATEKPSGSKEAPTEETGNDLPAWLNTDGTLPIVKEGTKKTLKVAIQMYADSGDPESQWFYQFIEREMNIHLEVQKFTAGNTSETLSLMFADGDLPDIIIGGGFGTSSLMNYGAQEGLLLDLAPYITKDLTPNLYKLYEEHPEYREAVEDEDGRVWSLGYINDTSDRGQISRAFINYDWLEAAGLKTPKTLDEFVDMLRAFKQRGANIVPMGGSWNSNNPCLILLNAFGYLTEDPSGMSIALRNGEVVLPVADREAYGEYLKLMRTLYEEELIDKNFFTTDTTTSRAIIAAGRAGYIANAPFVFLPGFTSWWGALPLTSEYNDKQQWPEGSAAMTAGGFVVSAKSENIELAMAFADWFFDEKALNYNLSCNGPAATQTAYIYDENVTGFTVDPETFEVTWPDYEANRNSYSSKNDYLGKEVYLWGYRILGIGRGNVADNLDALAYGYPPETIVDRYPDVSAPGVQGELRKETAGDGEMSFRSALEDTLVPYVTNEVYPAQVYLDAETATEMGNLMTIVKEFATQESAKFITGRKSFDELDTYFDQIERLGAAEVLETYREYYENNRTK